MLRVLIVEDDAILSFLNRKYVGLMGYEVVAACSNGEDAIETAKKYKPDIILMDVRLAGELTGIEAMHEINKFIDTKVIYTTASSSESDRAQAAGSNVLGFCVKPIDLDELRLLFLKEVVKSK